MNERDILLKTAPLNKISGIIGRKVVGKLLMQDDSQLLAQLNDYALVLRVQHHDKSAFSVLYDRYAPLVYALALPKLGRGAAEEAVQEIFMRLWRKADLFDATRGTFKSWFMMVAQNYLRDELKQIYQNNDHIDPTDWHKLAEQLADPTVNISETASIRDQSQSVRNALNTLPAEQKQVIIMAYFGDYTQSAIARKLDWPLGTVKKRIRLGMQKLREAMLIREEMGLSTD